MTKAMTDLLNGAERGFIEIQSGSQRGRGVAKRKTFGRRAMAAADALVAMGKLEQVSVSPLREKGSYTWVTYTFRVVA
jgi:hypothetical protein